MTPLHVGYALAALLCAIALFLIVRTVVRIALATRDGRRREATRVLRDLPGFGRFANYEAEPSWFSQGAVEGVHVVLEAPAWPPADGTVARLRDTLDHLPAHVAAAKALIDARERVDWTPPAGDPFAVEVGAGPTWVLEIWTPGESEHVFRVTFDGDAPVGYGIDG